MVLQMNHWRDWFAVLCDPPSSSTKRRFRLAEGVELLGARDRLARFDLDTSLVYCAPTAERDAKTHSVLLRLADVFRDVNQFGRMAGKSSFRSPFYMVAGNGVCVVDEVRSYIQDNRLELGDDGSWCVWPLRAFLSNQPGTCLEDLALASVDRSAPIVVPAAEPDYTDAVAQYRFPSLSILRGYSQPVACLRGQLRFTRLFMQDGPGLYIVFDGLKPLYVGMAQRLSQRLSSATSHHKLKSILECHPGARVATIPYPIWDMPDFSAVVTCADRERVWRRVRELLFSFEAACIAHYKPAYNWLTQGAMEGLAAATSGEGLG